MSYFGIEFEDDEMSENNPFGTYTEVVHEPGCWKEHGLCAINILNQLEILLKMSKKKIDKDEIRKLLEG